MGVGVAPVVSQSAVSRTTSAGLPTRSWSRVNLDRLFLTLAAPSVQPSGKERTQGTREAEGTDWARLEDPSAGLHRGVLLREGRAEAVLFIGPHHRLPARDWLAAVLAGKVEKVLSHDLSDLKRSIGG